VLTSDPQALVARLKERRLDTQYVREYFIPYRMTADRMEQVEMELRPAATMPVNRDFAPVAYAFDVVLWSGQFKSGYAEWFRAAEHANFGKVAGALAIALVISALLLSFLPGRERRKRAAAAGSVAVTGFTLMALELFLLLGFQAVYGYVYTELAILIGLFMAGMAVGSWLAMRRAGAGVRPADDSAAGLDLSRAGIAAKTAPASTLEKSFHLAATQLALALAGPAMLLAVSWLGGATAWLAAQVVFPLLAAVAGALGGFQFVLAAGIFVRDGERRSGLGALYAIDLIGGCAGALLLSGFLIPVFGFWRTAWLLAAINLAAAMVAARGGLRRA
jgi:spermidine synthase